jgi:hypothetical protein
MKTHSCRNYHFLLVHWVTRHIENNSDHPAVVGVAPLELVGAMSGEDVRAKLGEAVRVKSGKTIRAKSTKAIRAAAL